MPSVDKLFAFRGTNGIFSTAGVAMLLEGASPLDTALEAEAGNSKEMAKQQPSVADWEQFSSTCVLHDRDKRAISFSAFL